MAKKKKKEKKCNDPKKPEFQIRYYGRLGIPPPKEVLEAAESRS